jgi:group I intron endonuclease
VFGVSTEYKFKTGVYTITAKHSGLIYVGSAARCFYTRAKQHIYELRKNKHGNRLLQNIFNKYGEDNLVFEIIEEYPKNLCLGMEQYWMNMLSPALNLNSVTPSRLGAKLTPEQIAKMKQYRATEETKQKIREKRLKQVFSEEVLTRRSNSIRAKFNTPICCSNGKEYNSLLEAEADLGIPAGSISRIVRGYTHFSKTRHGLNFWYKLGYSNSAMSRKKRQEVSH